jgi:hypothetical protein
MLPDTLLQKMGELTINHNKWFLFDIWGNEQWCGVDICDFFFQSSITTTTITTTTTVNGK